MSSGIAKCMYATLLSLAGILASPGGFIAVFIVSAIVVTSTLYYSNCNSSQLVINDVDRIILDRYLNIKKKQLSLTLSTVSTGVYSISVLRWTHATTIFVYAETLFQIAYAVAFFVYHHIGLFATRNALVVLILTVSVRADAVTVFIMNLTSRT